MPDIIENHREIWKRKKILQTVYQQWYAAILEDLATDRGKTVEMGSGSGNFAEYYPLAISSDIVWYPWIDVCLDAQELPFCKDSVGNMVLIDVLHHFSNPVRFMQEALRVLTTGGRIAIIEPYPSPLAYLVYRLFHPEPFNCSEDFFAKVHPLKKDPWEANQAAAYLLFFKFYERFCVFFQDRWMFRRREKIACILYPASGGFERRALVPDVAIPFLMRLERWVEPFRDLLAFRCYIVLEKRR